MKTLVEELDNKFVVTLEGELDTAAAVEVDQTLSPLYKTNGKDVILNLENLEYISSSGLRILIRILKGARACGSKVTLQHVNDDIMNVFRLTGFVGIFNFE